MSRRHGDLAALVEFVHRFHPPHAQESTLRRHVADQLGKCRDCRTVWPCVHHHAAEQASKRQQEPS